VTHVGPDLQFQSAELKRTSAEEKQNAQLVAVMGRLRPLPEPSSREGRYVSRSGGCVRMNGPP
jgi:hypothetical protein